MHGLVNKAVELFVIDSYGGDKWEAVVRSADAPVATFEPMMLYDDAITDALIAAAATVTGHTRPDILEDLGTYLVSHPNMETIRRLLRFGGVTLVEFLHSLDDLPDRVRMAMPDLELPRIELREWSTSEFALICVSEVDGFGHVMIGILRALADDYGALALLDHQGRAGHVETVAITLIETDFAEGRAFELGARAS
ncbi:MAG: heme NO-binding domain-containing protein [Pseudomonadota bacterium]